MHLDLFDEFRPVYPVKAREGVIVGLVKKLDASRLGELLESAALSKM